MCVCVCVGGGGEGRGGGAGAGCKDKECAAKIFLGCVKVEYLLHAFLL